VLECHNDEKTRQVEIMKAYNTILLCEGYSVLVDQDENTYY